MGQSFLNLVDDKEVSIGIEQLLIAHFPTTWTPSKILDPVNAPPTGFRNLGAVVEDTVTMSLTREKFQLSTGIPKNLQYEAVMGITGILEASLIARRGTMAYYGLGGPPPVAPVPAGLFTVTTVFSQSEIFVASTVALSTITVGMLFAGGEVGVTGALERNSLKDAYVSSFSTTAVSPLGTTIVFSPTFTDTLIVGALIMDQDFQQQAFGTSRIEKFHLLGVADFIDGVQIVHDFPEVTPSGDWVEEFRPDQEGRIPVKFEAQGFTTTTYDNSISHVTVGERFWFSETV